ncbi:MAG TPA: UDP-N-acetylmuramoyl-L-alanine--D-glutamate ligase [Hydrogenophaga sp.]|uniref:UDP-N-acetylmuramoyl-L-alanine--D-glutamate ligase n=1 Tax=Hydrogenophaga sp. TaxID=1904254 RepID=UPI002B8E0811|nr:UDP-N-acetylmuramoyl-L-alanine--D-glutamate ligase [Hydrogenophaga sp.]HMN93497.1 UDP-N-acetylmuramoyl-L-alanine--D-glutamate ligase [Hydrogenophaga sp.]HMP09632.1 UDP-N-acetylmuramoyl-L-alanine--D-glutamate ligase [Hydrogenophaga sp.]
MNLLKDQNVLILGLGISGLAMARWCLRHGARVTVADTRAAPPQLQALQADCPQAGFVSRAFDTGLLAAGPWTMVARSPGLAPAELAAVRQWTQERQMAFVGELDLFAQALADLAIRDSLPYRPRVLAITGTNGKTTVTSLTGQLLRRAGQRVAVAGNIGPALLDVLGAALDEEAQAAEVECHPEDAFGALENQAFGDQEDKTRCAPMTVDAAAGGTPSGDPGDDGEDAPMPIEPPPARPPEPPHLPQVWVLELSSFQLDSVAGGAWDALPTAATILNLTEDHLDWHGSMEAYAQAKAAVFGTAALMVLNRDDERVMAWKPDQVTVKIGGRNRLRPARAFVTFGLDVPSRDGDWGLETVNGMAWLVRAQALDETRQRGRHAEDDAGLYLQRLMPADALRIRGRHNAANALAALALATSTGAALGPMLHGLRDYRGEPHRVEPVAIIEGVEYFDDSKGTNVGATLAAVQGLGIERPLVMILGGDGKGQDFRPLTDPLVRHARAVLLIGRDAPLLRQQLGPALSEAGVPLQDAPDLVQAVRVAADLARAGDAVLMSPACASLDMFDNYVHRARVFVDAVRELALERGVDLEASS